MASSRPKSDEEIPTPVEVTSEVRVCREDPTYPPGALVGSYWVEGVIGEGGTACVYRAKHAKIGRRVALKSLQGEYATNPEVVERFFAEARAANKVDHENIVQVTDLVEDPATGTYYFVMELLEGADLEELIELEGAMPVERAVRVAAQVADALAAAHDVGVIHRDLKPGNVYVLENERRDDFVKILDFGVAKVAAEIEQLNVELGRSDFHTKPGALIGTPAYMSPEQLSGKEVDHRTDVYSFGLLLYELVTGWPPFAGESFADLVVAHKTETPPPPRAKMQSPEELPEELQDLILRCLEKDPEKRPQSMAGILQLLVALASREGWRLEPQRPTTAPPPPMDEPRPSRPDTIRFHRQDLVEATRPSDDDITLDGLDRALVAASVAEVGADESERSSDLSAMEAVADALEGVLAQTMAIADAPPSAGAPESVEIVEGGLDLEAAGLAGRPPEGPVLVEPSVAAEREAAEPVALASAFEEEPFEEEPFEAAGLGARRSRVLLIALVVAACAVLGVVGYLFLRPAAPPAAEEPPPAAAAPSTVTFAFHSTPEGAEVYLEGEDAPMGTTPFEKAFPRSDERVTFEIRKAGYRPVRRSAQLSGDAQLAAALAPVPPPAAAETPTDDAGSAEPPPAGAAKAPRDRPRRGKRRGGRGKLRGGGGGSPAPAKRPRDLGALVDPYGE